MGKIGIIVRREFNERVRKKSFIFTTILTPLLMVGVMAVMVVLTQMKTDKERIIAVVDRSGQIASQMQNTDHIVFQQSDRSLDELRVGDPQESGLFGILVIGSDILESPRNMQLYTYESSTLDLEQAITDQVKKIIEARKLKSYQIENLDRILDEIQTNVSLQAYRIDTTGAEKESSSILSLGAAYIFGFLIYMFIFIYGGMVMQGVIEEKSSKVLEIMVSSVRPYDMMMGKILGIAAVAITQFLIWAVFLLVAGSAALHFVAGEALTGMAETMPTAGMMPAGMSNPDPEMVAALRRVTDPVYLGTLFGSFLIYFIGGYLLYAAMFAAIGSAVDNVADTQQLQIPVTIPIVLALIVMLNVMREPDSSLAVWFSLIPFTSPIIMMARIPYGVPTWEIVASIVLLYGTFIFMVWMAGKIYRVGIFMYGKKPTLKELYRWSRYKS